MSSNLAPLPDEMSIYPYSALSAIPVQTLLVFAPHPDDEVFGCGGIMAIALAAQRRVHVVVVTDGGRGGDADERERESRAAALALAGHHTPATLAFWREADRELRPTERLVRQMRASIAELRPDWVLVPSPGELHPDHRAVCLAACQAFRASFSPGHPARLGFYEVGQPLSPNVLVDITAVLDAKRAAMACFVSQLAQQRYDEQVLALNRFRAYTLGALVSHAEALQLLSADDLVDGLPGWLEQARQTMLRRLGLR